MIKTLVFLCGLFAPLAFAGLTVDTVGSITANVPLAAANASIGALEVGNGGTTTYYTSTGDKQVYVGAGLIRRVSNATGTTITVTFYDDADGTCSSVQKGGTYTLVNSAAPIELGWEVSNGICMAIAGTSPTVTVVTLP
jgi:hypothetical protein